jgi:hypothetical protein
MLIRFTQEQVTVFLWCLIVGIVISILIDVINGDN